MSDHERTLTAEQFGCPPLDLPFIDAQRRRLCFRKERPLYRRTCDATGESILSIYPPESPFKVFKADAWYGDGWDPLEYGRGFDFTRPFFEQFDELQVKIPRLALMNIKADNSDYCNMTYGNRNCYLIFGGDFNEDCMYGTLGMRNTFCLDVDYSNENDQCYELGDSLNCYGCQYVFDSKNCTNCYYISDCTGCTDCILSTNLKNKQFCIENRQYSKEEYLAKKREIVNGSAQQAKKNFEQLLELRGRRVVKFAHTMNCTDCTGDYLKNSKDCSMSFDVSESENLHNVVFATKAKDCLEAGPLGENTQHCFNTVACMGSHNVKMSYFIIDSRDIEYCKLVFNSHDLFGCVGLRHHQYCILNKQYSEAEYNDLRTRIVEHMKQTGEWGQFFPAQLSDFAYNETSAHDYFPLTKEEALAQGYKWRDEERKEPTPQTFEVPDRIADVDEQILKELLQCTECQKNFRILPQELAFYKEHVIAIPNLCSDCRHKRRMAIRNPRQLWKRDCQKCGVELESSYAPDRSETVYCERCYLQEVY